MPTALSSADNSSPRCVSRGRSSPSQMGASSSRRHADHCKWNSFYQVPQITRVLANDAVRQYVRPKKVRPKRLALWPEEC